MTANRFGGTWTRDKLMVLGQYLQFYAQALKRQRFDRVYIDAFAGTGRCKIPGEFGDEVIDGSAKIALDCEPAFSAYRFIERKRAHQRELRELLAQHHNGGRARVLKGKAQSLLSEALGEFDWTRTRGVLFLDPFGLQCTYPMLQDIARTEALDVFFLVSLSGLYRQAAVREADIDEHKAARLTAFLGTDEWRDAIYTHEQQDLWAGAQRSRARGWEEILQFVTRRLERVFPYVAQPKLMGITNGAPLFALYFAVSNPNTAAISLASRVSKDILSRLH